MSRRELRGLKGGEERFYVLLSKPCFTSSTNHSHRPSNFESLLQDYKDVFPEELTEGLPPKRGIEHHIDLISGASLPNRLAYHTNPEETKEI